MRDKEKDFLKCHSSIRSNKRHEYRCARDTFDRELRIAEREYKRTVATDIEQMATNNPNDFWSKINKLGPRKSTSIPMEVFDANGNPSFDQQCIYETWRSEFANLYNGAESADFDNDHYGRVLNKYWSLI